MEPKSLVSFFESPVAFEEGQRMAKLLCASSLVPKDFQNNIANTVIALEMAHRVKASPLAVMQNLYIVHGKPSWSGQFIIAVINGSGRFKGPLRMVVKGEGDEKECIAYATDLDGNVVEGAPVSIAMAKAEGWYQKNGSKWKTMPDLMLKYRAATFFGREYIPDLLMGMQTTEEIRDISTMESATITNHDKIAIKDTQLLGITEKINAEVSADGNEKVIDNDESCQKNDEIHSMNPWSPAAQSIIDQVDKLETSTAIDNYRMSKRAVIDTFGDEADEVFNYIENAYQLLLKV